MSSIGSISPPTTRLNTVSPELVAFTPSAGYVTVETVRAATASQQGMAALAQMLKNGATVASGAFAGVSLTAVGLLTAGFTVALNIGSSTHDDAPIRAALTLAGHLAADNPEYTLDDHVLRHNGTPIATITSQGFGPPPSETPWFRTSRSFRHLSMSLPRAARKSHSTRREFQ